jgi:acyl-CoA thioesterase
MMEMNEQQLAEACADSMYKADVASQNLGMTLLSIKPGQAIMTMDVRSDMLNGHQICHGGFIFSLADSAFAFACNSRNKKTVATGCKIDYVAPAALGDTLTATATVSFDRGRSGLCDVLVKNQKDEEIAFFRGNSRQIKGVHIENHSTGEAE